MTDENETEPKGDLLPGADLRERSGVCIGIDYGTKRIGVAISDTSWKLAFPLTVIQNGPSNKEKDSVIYEIRKILDEHDVQLVVIGESKDFKNKDNEIMDEVRDFKDTLDEEFWIETLFEPELFSTLQASRIQGEHATIDSSAAAVILQSYLDRIQAKEKAGRIERGEEVQEDDYQDYL
jgi:putative Holliday junction resolvase